MYNETAAAFHTFEISFGCELPICIEYRITRDVEFICQSAGGRQLGATFQFSAQNGFPHVSIKLLIERGVWGRDKWSFAKAGHILPLSLRGAILLFATTPALAPGASEQSYRNRRLLRVSIRCFATTRP